MPTIKQIAWRGVPPERSMLAARPRSLPPKRTEVGARLAAIWQAALDFIAPVGYEDESGFHHGKMPESKRANSPRPAPRSLE